MGESQSGVRAPVVPSPAWAVIDLDAIRHNVAALRSRVAPAEVCAVVKADGYGHGALAAARAALDAGATWVGVATVAEGVALREAGIDAPILLLSQPPGGFDAVVAHHLHATVYASSAIALLADAARAAGTVADVHLKVDTGMHRVGADPSEVLALARAIDADPNLHLRGTWTHLAVADEPDRPFTAEQLARFDAVLAALRAEGIDPGVVHTANSAGGIAHVAARRDLVRAGIAVYGLAPSLALAGASDFLRPALSLHSRVSHVRVVRAGEGISYGLRHVFDLDTVVATVPIGYADGVSRRLASLGASVLIRGRRRPMVGVVTMDQLMVSCGRPGTEADDVQVGDEVVLLGEQGGQRIDAWEWAERLGTIAYEVLCAIGPRVERIMIGG